MNRRTVFLGGFVAIGIIALWWVFLFSPLGADLDESRDELDDTKRDGLEMTAQLRELQELDRRGPEIEAQLQRLTAAIPEEVQQAEVIAGLNAIASASGIDWQSVTMQEPTASAPGSPPTIPVQIAIEGGYAATVDYLDRLEDFERLVVVDAVTLNGGDEDEGSGRGLTGSDELTISLTARMFSQRTLDSAAPPATGDAGTNGGSGGSRPGSGEVVN
jgi:Tfp pilus assembly protein PilO